MVPLVPEALIPFLPGIASAAYDASFDESERPAAAAAATVLRRGELTPPYRFLASHLGG
jgi:hypothetical protein